MTATTTAHSGYEMLSPRSVAREYDYSVHTIYEWIAEGRLTAYRLNDKPGSAYRVRRADVEALLKPVIPTEVYG